MTEYTVVQHSAGYSGDPTFAKGLEPRAVSKKQRDKVLALGGLVFPSYGEAEDFAETEMYRTVPGGSLSPNAPGTFSRSVVDGLRVYIPPKREEHATERFPVVDGLPLRLSFTPDAIREHFEGDEDPFLAALAEMDDATLKQIGVMALESDRLYETFHQVLVDAADEVLK